MGKMNDLWCPLARGKVMKFEMLRLISSWQASSTLMVSLLGWQITKASVVRCCRGPLSGEDGGFQPLAWPVSSVVVVMAGLWTSMSLWLPKRLRSKMSCLALTLQMSTLVGLKFDLMAELVRDFIGGSEDSCVAGSTSWWVSLWSGDADGGNHGLKTDI